MFQEYNNEIMNIAIFEYRARSLDPRIPLTGFVFEKSIHYGIPETIKSSRFGNAISEYPSPEYPNQETMR